MNSSKQATARPSSAISVDSSKVNKVIISCVPFYSSVAEKSNKRLVSDTIGAKVYVKAKRRFGRLLIRRSQLLRVTYPSVKGRSQHIDRPTYSS